MAKVRTFAPGAVEMVYDNYNGLVIGFVPNDRPSDAIVSVAVYPEHVSVCFLQAVASELPDPDGLLRGGGNVVRHIRLVDGLTLDTPAVRKLVAAAFRRARVRVDPKAKRRMAVRAVSARQRPRRIEPAEAPASSRGNRAGRMRTGGKR